MDTPADLEPVISCPDPLSSPAAAEYSTNLDVGTIVADYGSIKVVEVTREQSAELEKQAQLINFRREKLAKRLQEKQAKINSNRPAGD
jgi:hypothetical protein